MRDNLLVQDLHRFPILYQEDFIPKETSTEFRVLSVKVHIF